MSDEIQELPPEVSPDETGAIVRSSAVMSAGTALSRITGLLRLSAAVWALGVAETRLNDTYTIANTTPNILYELALGGILSSVFVPVFVEWMKKHGTDEAWKLGQRFLTFTIVVLGGLAAAAMIAAPAIIRLYSSGVADPSARAYLEQVGTLFLRFFIPQILFYGIGAVAIGLLQANRKFAVPMFAPILNNVTAIITFILFGLWAGPGRGDPGFLPTTAQQVLLGIGTTLGIVLMTAVLWPSLRRLGFRFHWRMPRGEGVRRVIHLAKWVVVYVVANQINFLIVILFAMPQQGGIAAYSLGFIVFQLPHAIVGVSIFTALLPLLSSHWTDARIPDFRDRLVEGLRLTGFLIIPAGLAYVVLAMPISRLLFEIGATGQQSTELIAEVLQMMSLGLFSFSAFQLFVRAFYAMQDSRRPALVNIGANAVNIAVNAALVARFGVQGLAIGLAVSYTVGAIVLGAAARRKLGGIGGIQLLGSLGRSCIVGVAVAGAAAGVTSLIHPGNDLERSLQVGAAVTTGLLVFVGIAKLLRMDELQSIASAFGRSKS